MNASVAATKRIVVVPDQEPAGRNAPYLTGDQHESFKNVVAVVSLHKPAGHMVAVLVPCYGPDSLFARRLEHHYAGEVQVEECKSLSSADCSTAMEEICAVLRALLSDPLFAASVILTPKQQSPKDIADRLMVRLRRPKRQYMRHSLTASDPFFVI